MFDHVTIRASDRASSQRFYETVLGELGIEQTYDGDEFVEWDDFSVAAGEPGPRPRYSESYYGAFLLDPDGNSAEAVHHAHLRRGGVVDHLWIRVADLVASTAFYERVAPHAGFRVVGGGEDPPRTRFSTGDGSFSVVAGAPTRNLHLAFPGTNARVDAFHAALVAAGHPDNGAPGERPRYHPGYYAAFVLDPDGNNVEVVAHNRPSA